MVIPNIIEVRREKITKPLLAVYRKMLPSMSNTEREALEAGSVWWEGELFSGMPDWDKLMSFPAPKLSEEEQAFVDGPCEELCRMLDDWAINHEIGDMPQGGLGLHHRAEILRDDHPEEIRWPRVLGLRERGRYSEARQPQRGRLEHRSAFRTRWAPPNCCCITAPRNRSSATCRASPTAPKFPAFALTSPQAGSDAASIIDSGVVCKGEWNGKTITGIRLNWSKRYITLAPIATVLGLAFKLYDPDHLIGDEDEYGITAALIPTDTEGVEVGRRHNPLSIAFMNGPTRGKDVFVPLDYIIGGPEMAGKGWKMLVELLSVGRAITLPATAAGGGQASSYSTGAYASIRKQFNTFDRELRRCR